MKIIHITAECYPVAKVGGLADVVGSLPKYQNNLGEDSSVLMPFYDTAFTKENSFSEVFSSEIDLDRTFSFSVRKLDKSTLGFELYFIDIPELLFTEYVYSEDDTLRFLAFQIAALQWICGLKEKPNVIHCHDHHTGLTPFMMSYANDFAQLKDVPSILTIHNAQYQGWFSHEKSHLIPEFDHQHFGLLDWDHSINPLAAAIKCAWKVTTVSPSYMEELKQNANGLEQLLAHESAKCIGILNGIDVNVWNTETDPFILKNYSLSTLDAGKKANKDWLCKEYGLNPKLPLFVFIGRLVGEKGADLFPEIFDKVLNAHQISVLLLGSGSKDIELGLSELNTKHSGAYNSYIGYDEKLSHIIYAGADFLLMPSRVEPCGLNQMYSLRYGTIPVVNAVGGLKDTVIDLNEEGFGILHKELSVDLAAEAIARGVELFKNQKKFKEIRKEIMSIDHSWDVSAEEYIKLYKSIK